MNNADTEYFAKVARNIRSARLLHKVDAAVRVESMADIVFWQKMLTAKHDLKVKFYPAELSDSGIKQTGKSICMRYAPYYDRYYFACIDSDFDKILHPTKLSPKKYMIQTHTYSWENHYCQAKQLQLKWNVVERTMDFDFELFLMLLSQILYPVLIEMLAIQASKRKSWKLDELCGVILSCQVNKRGYLKHNGEQILKEISKKISEWRSKQSTPSDSKVQQIKQSASTIGWDVNNTYLYMQGHCIFDLILRIGKVLCPSDYDFQYLVLQTDLVYDGYPEVVYIQNDISTLLSK